MRAERPSVTALAAPNAGRDGRRAKPASARTAMAANSSSAASTGRIAENSRSAAAHTPTAQPVACAAPQSSPRGGINPRIGASPPPNIAGPSRRFHKERSRDAPIMRRNGARSPAGKQGARKCDRDARLPMSSRARIVGRDEAGGTIRR